MLNTIRITNEQIALELFSGADAKNLLINAIPKMIDNIKGFLNLHTTDEPAISLTVKENNFIRTISDKPYSEISLLGAFVPEGLITTYLEYSTPLLHAVEHASVISTKTISNYTTFLAKLASVNGYEKSSFNQESDYKLLEKQRDVINTEIGRCFKPGSSKTDVFVEDVIARGNEWAKVFEINTKMINLINSVNRKELNKKIAECSELLDLITKKIKNNEFENISKENVNNLSMGAYQIARELEHFSVTYYRVVSLSESINRTVALLMDVYKL